MISTPMYIQETRANKWIYLGGAQKELCNTNSPMALDAQFPG